jgi:hypothetical protein
MVMAVSCFIKVVDAPAGGWSPVVTFEQVPRVGEFVTFSLDGKRDEHGVLRTNLYRVKHVIHTAASELTAPMITLDVEVERYANRI